MIRSAPGERAGVAVSGSAAGAPSAMRTWPSRSIRRRSSITSSWLSSRLVGDLALPKCAGTMPCSSNDGVKSAWTIANWSSASFLASVFRITRVRFSGGIAGGSAGGAA